MALQRALDAFALLSDADKATFARVTRNRADFVPSPLCWKFAFGRPSQFRDEGRTALAMHGFGDRIFLTGFSVPTANCVTIRFRLHSRDGVIDGGMGAMSLGVAAPSLAHGDKVHCVQCHSGKCAALVPFDHWPSRGTTLEPAWGPTVMRGGLEDENFAGWAGTNIVVLRIEAGRLLVARGDGQEDHMRFTTCTTQGVHHTRGLRAPYMLPPRVRVWALLGFETDSIELLSAVVHGLPGSARTFRLVTLRAPLSLPLELATLIWQMALEGSGGEGEADCEVPAQAQGEEDQEGSIDDEEEEGESEEEGEVESDMDL